MYVIWPASHQCPDGPHEPFREVAPALGKSQKCRSVSVTPEGHLPVICFLSLGQTLCGWPLAPTVARPTGFSEIVPTSGKGFCCRSHSKVQKMGGGHRIRPLLVAYVVCSPTLRGQPMTGGRIPSIFNSGKVCSSDDSCLVLKSSHLWFICLFPFSLFLPFVFGVSLDLCMRLIKGSTGFSILNHPLKDAGVAPHPTPRVGQRQCWWELGECSCGCQGQAHAQHLTELLPKQRLPRGAPVPGVGGGRPESPSLGSGAGELAPQGFVSVNSGQGPLHLQTAQGWDGWGKEAFSDIHGCSWAAPGALCPSVGTSLQDKIPPGSLAYLPGMHWEGWP